MKEVCIHGHFYQPTRVNPWTDQVEAQPSAAPFANWNERIHAECYAPNASAQLLGDGITRAARNNYSSITFDFGPTLLHWLERNHPVVLEAIRRADRDSISQFGHGSAMAQPYHHPILPLCDTLDLDTEIAWGLDIFEQTFERPAEGMWLSECAVNTATLEALARRDVRFVVLAPHQIEAIRDPETDTWTDVNESLAANQAFRIDLPSGKDITVVAYDGLASRAIAFDGLLHDGNNFANRLVDAARRTGLALVSTDGESYGHHHHRGEMALAYALEQLEARSDVQVTNVASWVARNPPKLVGRIREDSSWSCSHGVERWRSDCGCKSDFDRPWHQKWRGPLREAFEDLRDRSRTALKAHGDLLFLDPIAARDAYGRVLKDPKSFSSWYQVHAGSQPSEQDAKTWLEIHRHLLASFTSCAWFFDEVTGLEPIQNIRHASCAITLLQELTGVDLRSEFRDALINIPGNLGPDALLKAFDQAGEPMQRSLTPRRPLVEGNRRAGVLNPVSALGGAGPIGDLDGAVAFIDWLVEGGISLWQVLPLTPPDSTGSPYSSWSALSGNPDLVGLENCIRAGLLAPSARLAPLDRVDYGEVRRVKRPLVLEAAASLLDQPKHPWSVDLERFKEEAVWAEEAALYYALKSAHDGNPWWLWPEPLRKAQTKALAKARRTLYKEISHWQAALFLFERQWAQVRTHAASRGVQLVGDMPIYVGQDSVDVWLNQDLFLLDANGRPAEVAGVPPDAYSEAGQLWGNPLYNWSAMAEDGYSWWVRRIRRALEHCDALRIDHFIGFSRFWSVDAGEEDARGGAWSKGPGRALFEALEAQLGPLPLIAEDLGEVDSGTVELRDGLRLPGMRVGVFGYDGNQDNLHHPSNHPVRSVAYSSTHDSDTARGWWESQGEEQRARLGLGQEGWTASRKMVDEVLSSQAGWAIIQLQDILQLGSDARMNLPGTVGGNWSWRQPQRHLDLKIAQDVRVRVRRSGRLAVQAHRSDSAPTAAAGARADFSGPCVAYFCMEYGISHTLPIYSGGLGVLAGDIVKAAADQNRNFIALGILWGEGYFVQDIDEEGRQVERYVATPRSRLRPTGIEVHIDVGGKSIPVTAWRVLHMGSVELILLEPLQEEDRWITQRLYGGNNYDRVAQEILLGVGGVRALRALGLPVEVYHFNEGHALFAGLELMREAIADGCSMEQAQERVKAKTIFTTHTPVPAGNEVHPIELLQQVGVGLGTFSDEDLKRLGGSPFQMTPAALRLARKANAVAELHGETARGMWKDVEGAAPIVAITNGVHMGTWQDPQISNESQRGKDSDLWARHQRLKSELIEDVQSRVGTRFREDVLLIGFARRAATYKRANLLLRNPAWLEQLFEEDRIQLLFAGKAHPRDKFGGALIQELALAAKRYPDNLVFLPNYDMHLGAVLTRGCDVWLNNPIRPMEASGTSGMKAAANGVLNLSILDGWWDEGCDHGVNGWGVDAPPAGVDPDQHDFEALKNLIDTEVLPTYENDRDQWINMMRSSIGDAEVRFSADRCVRRYYEELYEQSVEKRESQSKESLKTTMGKSGSFPGSLDTPTGNPSC